MTDDSDEMGSGHGNGPTGRSEPGRPLWFRRKEDGFPVAVVSWQGRAAAVLYAFLVVVAVVTYSRLALTAFVIAFYTIAFGLLVVVKSDIVEHHPPGGDAG